MRKVVTVLASLLLAGALSAVSFAQQDQSSQPSPSAQQPSPDQNSTQPSTPTQDSSSSMQATQGSSFTGTIAKAKGQYVLNTAGATYQLDDQQKAKAFAGQQVKVSGSLDSNTATIHVSDISAAR